MPSVPDLVAQTYENVYEPSSSELAVQIYENVGTGFPPQTEQFVPLLPPPCHIPHKRWSGDAREEQNYYTIERWSHQLHLHPAPVALHLHIPYKHWDNEFEAANYLAIERWALEIQTDAYRRPLFFPHKRWAKGQRLDWELEEDNYRYLENWSLQFIGYPGTLIPGDPPIYPNLVVQVYENVTT